MSANAGRSAGIMAFGLLAGGLGGLAVGALGLAGTTMGSILVGVAYMGGSFLGQMVFPAPNQRNMPTASDYPMQTVDRGSAVPVTYGTLRTAGNLVWMGPLQEYDISGGKGGGGEEGTGYRRSFLISICEGPRDVLRIWKGKHEVSIAEGNDDKTGRIGVLFDGVLQEVTVFNGDGFNYGLETLIGEDYSKYKHDCCVLFKNYDLGTVDSIPGFLFEVGPYQPYLSYFQNGHGVTVRDRDFEAGGGITSAGVATYWEDIRQTDIDAAGNVIFGGQRASTDLYQTIYYWPVDQQITYAGTIDLMPYEGSEGWMHPDDRDNLWTILACGCAFDNSGDYAYVTVRTTWTFDPSIGYRYHLYKINVHTKEVAWRYPSEKIGLEGKPGRVRVDSGNNAWFVVNSWEALGVNYVVRVKPNGQRGNEEDDYYHALLPMLTDGWINDLWIDEGFQLIDPETGEMHTGFLFVCGLYGSYPYQQFYAGWYSMKNSADYAVAIYGPDATVHGTERGFTTVRSYNNFVYLGGSRQVNGDNDAVQIYSGLGTKIAGWDCGPSLYEPEEGNIPRVEGLAMHRNGTIVAAVPFNDAIFELSAGDLTLLDTHDFTFFHTGSGGMGDLVCFDASEIKDANPSAIILDLLTHRRYGAAMPGDYIDGDSFAEIYQYCEEEDLLISVDIHSSKSLLDWIQYICSHFGGFLYWMGGQLYLGAWRGEDPEFHLTRDHLAIDEQGIPVQVRKRKYSESCNHVELGWQSRDDNYGPAEIPFRDDVDIRLSGKRRKNQISLSGVKRLTLANKMGWRFLIDSMYRFGYYTFRLASKDMLLHVGQVGLLTDGFRITDQRIRITSISEAKDGSGMDIEAVDDISNLYPDLSDRTAQTTLRVPDTVVTTDDLGAPTISVYEDPESRELKVALSPTVAETSGYRIYISYDGETYTLYDRVFAGGITGGGSNSTGTLLSSLPSAEAPMWRGDESFLVDIGTVTDLRTDITASQFFHGEAIARIGDEIIGYKTCVEQDTEGQWKVTELLRGMYGTDPVAHEIGETFETLDTDATISYDPSDIGRTIYIKALPYSGTVSLSLADVEATTYTIEGASDLPYGAALVRLTSDEMDGWDASYSGDALTLYWNLPGKETGFNLGGQDGDGTWVWGDDTSELVPQHGVLWDAYAQDPDLEGVDVVFMDSAGGLIGTQHLGVVSTVTISKADDLGGNNPATIEIYPRYGRRSIHGESVTVDDGS